MFDHLGSPFQYTVGQLTTGGAHKVQVGGPGLERGEVNLDSKPLVKDFK